MSLETNSASEIQAKLTWTEVQVNYIWLDFAWEPGPGLCCWHRFPCECFKADMQVPHPHAGDRGYKVTSTSWVTSEWCKPVCGRAHWGSKAACCRADWSIKSACSKVAWIVNLSVVSCGSKSAVVKQFEAVTLPVVKQTGVVNLPVVKQTGSKSACGKADWGSKSAWCKAGWGSSG